MAAFERNSEKADLRCARAKDAVPNEKRLTHAAVGQVMQEQVWRSLAFSCARNAEPDKRGGSPPAGHINQTSPRAKRQALVRR
jgi:hypothetical protein